jgi:hypothetical protein
LPQASDYRLPPLTDGQLKAAAATIAYDKTVLEAKTVMMMAVESGECNTKEYQPAAATNAGLISAADALAAQVHTEYGIA